MNLIEQLERDGFTLKRKATTGDGLRSLGQSVFCWISAPT